WGRDRILTAINRLDVPCFGGSCSEVYREVAFKHSRFRREGRLPVARELGDTSLMFPVHPTMTADDMVHIANAIEYVMQQAQA
ncbi:MAG: aminotransferase, partial [Sedimenticolaceae bacterium]